MRVLHVVKTSDGAAWAADQAASLCRAGVEVHVALPANTGAMLKTWCQSGAVLHIEDLSLPTSEPWKIGEVCRRTRRLVDQVQPSLIHSHFFTTTMLLRMALGRISSMPLLFQVPGPLHLENACFRHWDLKSARPSDHWIGSSRCIVEHYWRAGVKDPVSLSYYGFRPELIATKRTNCLRNRLAIPVRQRVVGSISHVYAPKLYLGQRHGLKNHETMIEALAQVTRQRPDVTGVLAGGPWRGAERYYERLRKMASQLGKGRILMPGALSHSDARLSWADFDCVVHIPTSENCGGVVEPLAAHVPVVAARVGGLPEVVIDGRTGVTVSPKPTATETAQAVLNVLEDLPNHRCMASTGARLVNRMFSVERTSAEILGIYKHICDPGKHSLPPFFDSSTALNEMEREHANS